MQTFISRLAASFFLVLVQVSVDCNTLPAFAQNQESTEPVIIAQSKVFEAPDNKVQHFSEFIDLVPGQDKLDLTLTYYNGTATKPGFKWIRVTSSTMNYLTEKQFDGKKAFSIDVSGDLAAGGNQIIVEAAGVAGSTFSWRLTAAKPLVQSVQPVSADAGSIVTITGKNFCTDTSVDSATINGAALTCVAATASTMVLKIPDTLKAGSGVVKVQVAGLDAGHCNLNIENSIATLKGTSVTYVGPACNFTIYGGPFSATAAGNKVTVGPFQAQVIKAGVDSLEVQAPSEFGGNDWGIHQPVKVWVNGMRSRNNLFINCYNMY